MVKNRVGRPPRHFLSDKFSSDQKKKIRKIWSNIETRCTNPAVHKFGFYGGKGIKNNITLEQLGKLWLRDNADSLEIPSIDRIEHDKDYTFENCRFIEFAANRLHRKKTRCPQCAKMKEFRSAGICVDCQNLNRKSKCRVCGIVLENQGWYCQQHRTIPTPCNTCGTIFPLSRQRKSQHYAANPLRRQSSDLFYCNRRCFGKWLGKNFGRRRLNLRADL